MLKTVKLSQANKTAGIAVTYRAGDADIFGTCPADCKLNDSGRGCAPSDIDAEYLDAVLDAKPRRGESFTYSHFNPLFWAHKLAPNKTTINYSADTLADAVRMVKDKIAPVVTVVKKSFWKNGKNAIADGVRVIRCPAEYLDNIGCVNCGNGQPLCARLDRDYVIGFTGHGASKKKIENDKRGGCYAAGGNVAIHWRATSGQEQEQSDAQTLRDFVKTLPPRSVLRHHVAGDIGKE